MRTARAASLAMVCGAVIATAVPAVPAPQRAGVQSLPTGNGFAVAFRSPTTSACEREGATASINATVPDTIGAAKLVPPVCVMASFSGVVRPLLDSATRLPRPKPIVNEPPGADNVMPLPKLL